LKYSMSLTTVDCPVCGPGPGRLLYEVDVEQAVRNFVLPEVDRERSARLRAHIEHLWGGPKCRQLRCDRCTLVFADPLVPGDRTFYELAYERTRYPGWKWEHEVTRQALVRRAQAPDRLTLLELGAGDGAFLQGITPELVRQEGVLATEFSDFGRHALVDAGFQCSDADLTELCTACGDRRFSVICLFQILEHLGNPVTVMGRLKDLSNADTQLFLSVPNDTFIRFIETHDTVLDMPPNHVTRGNVRALKALASRTGWRLADHRKDVNEPYSARALKFAKYRYLRTSQSPRSLANRVETLGVSRRLRLLRPVVAACYGVACLPDFLALRSGEYGSSQWACLESDGAGAS